MHHRAPGPARSAPLRAAAGRLSDRLARRRKGLLGLTAVLAVASGGGIALPSVMAPAGGPAAVDLTDAARTQHVGALATGSGTPGSPAAAASAAGAPTGTLRTPVPAGSAAVSSGATSAAPGSAATTADPAAADAAAIDRQEHRADQRKNRPAAPTAPNPACTLTVPAAPTTAAGLATPYRLGATDRRAGACSESNPDQSAFVEAAVYDPAAHAVSVYHPVVVDGSGRPAVPPVPVSLPAGAVVGIWFGFNGDTLTLAGPGAADCVNGLPGSPFGQFAYCDAPAFFAAVNGDPQVVIPPLGTASDGRPCPTTRDFAVVDQDQSDNLATVYRVLHGRIAQDTAATRAGTALTNGSDEGLLAKKIDPALGCTPPTAPDLTDGGAPTPSLALNELSAARFQHAPVALVPLSDPMVQVDGRSSARKTDLYRAGVDQPSLVVDRGESPAAYCADLVSVAPDRLVAEARLLGHGSSPSTDFPNLLAFLVNRLQGSLTNLSCTPDRRVTATLAALAKAAGGTPAP